MKNIIFDELSFKWDKNPDFNPIILQHEFRILEDRLKYRGYLYLNQVYEALGINWDPDDENICYRKEEGPVKFSYEPTVLNTYRILITR